jgi:hypothetical protein
MRRMLPILVVTGVTTGFWAVPASAGVSSLTIRSDPNDSSGVLGIRRVASDLSNNQVYMAVRIWGTFTKDDLNQDDNSWIVVYLDTKRRGAADRRLFLSYDPSQSRFECSVFIVGGGFKGERQAGTSGDQAIGCLTPSKWFDIQKQVKFGVESYQKGNFQDRAPNDGRYRGL